MYLDFVIIKIRWKFLELHFLAHKTNKIQDNYVSILNVTYIVEVKLGLLTNTNCFVHSRNCVNTKQQTCFAPIPLMNADYLHSSSNYTCVGVRMLTTRYHVVQQMNCFVLLFQWWRDILLQWNPEDFGGVDHVRVPATHIWTPDIVLYNQ